MEFEKKCGVNYEYILALKNEGERVSVVQIPINRKDNAIDRALNYLEDEDFDATDVYRAVSMHLYDETYNYCLAHEYSAYYIDPIKSQKFDFQEYQRRLNARISSKVEYKKRRLQNITPETHRNLEKEAWRELYSLIRKDKELMVNFALPCIYANDYQTTIINNRIATDYIAYSNEIIGYYRPEHQVNDDISVKIDTIFCYGSSSYFHVIVSYKGIALLPFSIWVRYYYAGISELLGCTRSYSCRRESWHTCMDFLANFINCALSNPQSFIRNEVMTEVNGLIRGLEEIFNYDEERYEKELKVKERPGDERYIGIRGIRYANDADEQNYKIAPHEISMIYKMEKISGALRFLDNLRQINEIYSEISDVIDRIIEMNRLILPEVEEAIPPVEEEIIALNKELAPLQKQYNSLSVTVDRFEKN